MAIMKITELVEWHKRKTLELRAEQEAEDKAFAEAIANIPGGRWHVEGGIIVYSGEMPEETDSNSVDTNPLQT